MLETTRGVKQRGTGWVQKCIKKTSSSSKILRIDIARLCTIKKHAHVKKLSFNSTFYYSISFLADQPDIALTVYSLSNFRTL
jgi:hypothetical protein